MITQILTKIFGSANDRAVQKLQITVDKINALEPSIQNLSDAQLKEKTLEFRQLLAGGKSLDDILPQAFAVAREACQRTLGMRPFDVQLMGAIVLHSGKVAEMKTGEGKTLTATLALYLNALSGKGAHLVTVNDYLARRDSEWNRPMYEFLGLTVGVLTHDMHDHEKKAQYNCDVLYATNNELGFDYLRDNMKFRYEDYVQRDLNFAIVDECDSILIDEARTPLIISGAAERSSDLYKLAQSVIRDLIPKTDFEIDEKARSIQLTEEGHDKIENRLNVKNLYAVENINLLHHVTQALRANFIFKIDVDYVVRDDEVLIVDEFTGRILSGRRYSDGLHQAIEAKEGVKIEQETQTLASITLQNFFRMYKKLAGMTGTAMTEAEEFAKIYKLDVVSIPTNRAMIRADKDDIIFLTERAKYQAIVDDVKARHHKGQPVLIGTIAVEKSEKLSSVLTKEKIPHEVLNAKQHAREAEIIAFAGQPGNVTIATNMAGRGTDIKLHPTSLVAGGLYVLGTERHESRRIDNQLRGRSGRQGDAGESRFYISLEDDLIRIFAGDSMKRTMERAGMKEDEQIESKTVSKLIEHSQEKVEKHNFEIRKHLIEYDDVLNQHRKVIYTLRQNILKDANNIAEITQDLIVASIADLVNAHCQDKNISPEQVAQILDAVALSMGLPMETLKSQKFSTLSADDFERDLTNFICAKYIEFRNKIGAEQIQDAEKWIMLETIDQAWKQHMINIDHLKEGIGLRGWGQKNPLIEYKKEAFEMFEEMMQQIRTDIVHHIFHIKPEAFDQSRLIERRERELNEMKMNAGDNDKSEKSSETVRREEDKVGRNNPCSCGSGKKFKKCCG
ncbi:preprotein translocase subunit SecA [candidate division TM6 bacterium RIFCSPHIGHO2_12_FULL_38_8]|nr:MAG: preprotein translocase subunit SecA [candidate division TM6 bacterium RIFCSPHIGHO2_12_FULL_38_8]